MVNDERTIYWIWLQQILKYGNCKVNLISKFYHNAVNVYNDSEFNRKLSGLFTSKEIYRMSNTPITDAKKIYDRCNELGYEIVTYDSEKYPERLKNIPNPPCVLYVKGNLPDLDDNICVSVVGSRNASVYGVNMAFEISHDLAKSGAIVISGGAVGIDSAAHRGAIQGNGKTIVVMACGINYDYLRTNISLRNVIAQKGALISEYPPDYPVYSSNFIVRNRIVSGLSLCTVVVEAGQKSGSLITANLALDQNRDVFVTVPNNTESPMLRGVMNLINDGARVVTDAKDIINEYQKNIHKEKCENRFKVRRIRSDIIEQAMKDNITQDNDEKMFEHDNCNEASKRKNSDIVKNLSDNAKKVYDLLENRKYHIDEISLLSNLSVKELLPVITELEICDVLRAYSGRMYGKTF